MNASNMSSEMKWPSRYYSNVFSLHDIVKGTGLSMIALIVIIGNVICLFALKRTQIKQATKVLMYSLNTADLCAGIFVILPAVVSSYINDLDFWVSWMFPQLLSRWTNVSHQQFDFVGYGS